MARHKEAPYHVRAVQGRAVLDYRTPDGRKIVYLGFAYAGPKLASRADRAAAERKGEEKYRELTDGRVLDEDQRIKTSLTFQELYGQYQAQFEPDDNEDVNTRKAKRDKCVVLEAYGNTIMKWAGDEAKRPDGSRLWRGDNRTPLQRLLAQDGPECFLAWRLTKVKRNTMRKEKSNLVQFLSWAKGSGYLLTVPTVTLPSGKGKPAIISGRGIDIHLTAEEARRIVAVLPEWSSKPTRGKAANPGRYLVKAFFDFMSLTGLRPVTIKRLMVGRNWDPKKRPDAIELTNADDKNKYGRIFPLSEMAAALLEKYAPESGHIFGHHDYRDQIKAAAALVLDAPRAELFGSYHLRHFIGTFLASRTTNTAAGMYLMGQTNPATFGKYIHAREQEARALVDQTAPELARVAKAAEKWAAKKLREGEHVH